ncbi:MAG: CPBP family intramembrane metalloprotease [Acidobacteriaceae bacterium]|nr:CPBP family intramembrane metalloprotease [Acidobacteriaceae bacterium]
MEQNLAPTSASPSFTPQPKPNPVFFGRFGLRAGYGIAIFLVAALALMTLGSIFSIAASGNMKAVMNARANAQAHPQAPHPHLHIDFTPALPIVQDGITFLGMLGVCWFFSRGEERPLRSYGLGRNRVRDLLPGAFWGLAMMSALILVLRTGGWLIFDGRNLAGFGALRYGLAWLLAFLLVGFSEEYMFRGYLQFALTRGMWGAARALAPTAPRAAAFWIAATLLSLLFACAHISNGGETMLGIAQVFFAGMVFCYGLWRTGSLWWTVGFHMTWDWAQSFLFGVADSGNVSFGRLFNTHPAGNPLLSGGTTGPEGSLLSTAALALTLLVLRLTTRPGAQPEILPVEPEALPPGQFHNELP